jgi:hypothetical protein
VESAAARCRGEPSPPSVDRDVHGEVLRNQFEHEPGPRCPPFVAGQVEPKGEVNAELSRGTRALLVHGYSQSLVEHLLELAQGRTQVVPCAGLASGRSAIATANDALAFDITTVLDVDTDDRDAFERGESRRNSGVG